MTAATQADGIGTQASISRALRRLARSPEHRRAFETDGMLRQTLWPAACRYILAEDRGGLLERLPVLQNRGYRLTVEVVGEKAATLADVDGVMSEYLALLRAVPAVLGVPVQLGFDLSNVGSALSWELAAENTARLLEAAAEQGAEVMLSMEESAQLPDILGVFETLRAGHANVGVTLQAYLHRTPDDVARVAATGAKVRLVKGAYDEPPEIALPRGPELDARYVDLIGQLLDAGVPTSLASHDPQVHALARERGLLSSVEEVEMLHGVRPAVLRGLREEGLPCRIYCVYGRNWWLHLLHRLAEHPPDVLESLADLGDPGRTVFGAAY
ncbi:proline dehydrogenase family protein [Nonomuraea typhae]|uniref:Proline dehydrogenase family protein n=1 Tax=Nonomuraea typhae TaxID=2603600 RepID=A0ABW7Z9B7_9ACTN